VASAHAARRCQYQQTTVSFSDNVTGGGQLTASLTSAATYANLNVTIASSGSYYSRLTTRCSNNHLSEIPRNDVSGVTLPTFAVATSSHSASKAPLTTSEQRALRSEAGHPKPPAIGKAAQATGGVERPSEPPAGPVVPGWRRPQRCLDRRGWGEVALQVAMQPISWLLSRIRSTPNRAVARVVSGELLGSDYGGYVVNSHGIGPQSVVYSFGIGEDVSFDLAMVERFGVTVHAFDPTPRSIEWFRRLSPPGVVLHEYGLHDYDGKVRFNPPKDPTHVSHSVLDESVSDRITSAGSAEFEVKRLETVMRELGHAQIDVLKMDVEGAEYAVIDDLTKSDLKVQQLLLEFHHKLPGIGLRRTERAIDQLRAWGMEPFHCAANGQEWSFLRIGCRHPS
jgi:FkbM family methyltransferase